MPIRVERVTLSERAAFAFGGFIAAVVAVIIGDMDRAIPMAVCEVLLAVGCLALMMPVYAARTKDKVRLLMIATAITMALATVNLAYFIAGPLATLAFILYKNYETKRGTDQRHHPI